MKRGQAQQIFIWIFVLILATSILFFGIKTVKKGEELKDEVLLVDFFKNLENKINNYYYLDVGSSGVEEFILPSGVGEVCFIDDRYNNLGDRLDKNDYFNSLKEFSDVFVFSDKNYKQNRYNITHSEVGNVARCFNVNGGRLRIKLENIGNNVEIKYV